MKLSHKWLLELTGLDWSAEEVAERLTLCGTACEYIERADEYMDKVVVGEVTTLKPVEGADKIQLATVNLGERTMEVICGAPNVAEGQKVPVALEGARLAGGMVIRKVKIRGIESSAMICSERELGISDDHSGIMVLDKEARPGQPLPEHLSFDDHVLTFELTPNRADSMSAIGIARDLAALASVKVVRPETNLKESSDRASDHIAVKIDDPIGCPRYAARVIRNVKIGPSPWWLKRKLLLGGVRPISNIVDITNLVMLETGHPLHAFDLDRFGSSEVVVRRAKDKENFTTLDGQDHTLSSDVLLITNGKEGVAVGGVMGGLESEVEDSTTNILLEAAYFDPGVIRRGRRELGMVTESSSRFEKGADPNGIPYAIDRAASLMQQLCGGDVLAGVVDCYPKKIEPVRTNFRPARCVSLLGVEITVDRMKQIFTDLEFEVKGNEVLEVVVPTFRPDICREVDLIEEVARVEGFDKIPDAIENIGPLFTPIHYIDRFKAQMRQIVTAAGFSEMVHHGLVDGRRAELLNPGSPVAKVINPVSEDLNVLRNCLVQTMLTALSYNISHRNLDLCLFEIGPTFHPGNGEFQWREEDRLVLAVTGETEHTWRDRPRPLDFYDISGTVSRLAEHYSWGTVEYLPESVPYLEPDISFAVMVGGHKLGHIGRVTAKVTGRFDIKQTVHIAEIDLEPLIASGGTLVPYEPLPVYPAALRDLAMIVSESVKAGDLQAAVKDAAGDIAERVQIFDLYRGKQIEKGKKSIAIAISYRSREGNLSSEEVDQRQKAVVKRLQKEFNAQIRDK